MANKHPTYPSDVALTAVQSFLSSNGHAVDYARLASSSLLKSTTAFYAAARDNLKSYTALEKACFYVNAHNWLVLQSLVDLRAPAAYAGHVSWWKRYQFFSSRKVTVAGSALSLKALVNDVIRPLCVGELKDARVHVLLNCGSQGAPLLPSQFLTPDNWATLADASAREFVNSERGARGVTDTRGQSLHLSLIFKLYAADFAAVSGSALDFVKKFADESRRKWLDHTVVYAPFNWALNNGSFPVKDSYAETAGKKKSKSGDAADKLASRHEFTVSKRKKGDQKRSSMTAHEAMKKSIEKVVPAADEAAEGASGRRRRKRSNRPNENKPLDTEKLEERHQYTSSKRNGEKNEKEHGSGRGGRRRKEKV